MEDFGWQAFGLRNSSSSDHLPWHLEHVMAFHDYVLEIFDLDTFVESWLGVDVKIPMSEEHPTYAQGNVHVGLFSISFWETIVDVSATRKAAFPSKHFFIANDTFNLSCLNLLGPLFEGSFSCREGLRGASSSMKIAGQVGLVGFWAGIVGFGDGTVGFWAGIVGFWDGTVGFLDVLGDTVGSWSVAALEHIATKTVNFASTIGCHHALLSLYGFSHNYCAILEHSKGIPKDKVDGATDGAITIELALGLSIK
ncbi:hypothetical protein CR513_31109, partial [Mucuna pruriens]